MAKRNRADRLTPSATHGTDIEHQQGGSEQMVLRLLGHVELPANRAQGGFDHADIHAPTDRLYVAHTSNDAIDVVDIASDKYIESVPGLTGGAGGVVSEGRALVCTSDRGGNKLLVLLAGSGPHTVTDLV